MAVPFICSERRGGIEGRREGEGDNYEQEEKEEEEEEINAQLSNMCIKDQRCVTLSDKKKSMCTKQNI